MKGYSFFHPQLAITTWHPPQLLYSCSRPSLFLRPVKLLIEKCTSPVNIATDFEIAPSYPPSVWNDFFIIHSHNALPSQSSEQWMRERVKQLKEEVCVLFQNCKNNVEEMNLVDVLQRLGIDQYFEEQISTTLHNIHNVHFYSDCLYEISLRFRLLRQQGLWVSPGVFNNFKNQDGGFIMGTTLDEAILFARRHLELIRSSLKSPLAEQVTRSLQTPLPRTMKKVEALNYIAEYNEQEQAYNPAVLELAKIEFNRLQHHYIRELNVISQWWKNLSTKIGLDYARDRVIECYFLSYNVYHEEEHARARMIFAKISVLWTLLDDTIDIGATLDECRKLNQAIQRWNESAAYLLPEYLQKFFLKIISNFREFDNELDPHQKYNGSYYRKAFQRLSSCCLQESEWLYNNHMPSFKYRMNVSSMTGGHFACVVIFGLDDVIETFDWAIGSDDVATACGVLTRYLNDMAAFKNGSYKMDASSSVECFMKDHKVNAEIALAKITDLVENSWKTINEAHFKHRPQLLLVQRVSRFIMCSMFFYHGMKDLFTDSKDLRETIESHFINPIAL